MRTRPPGWVRVAATMFRVCARVMPRGFRERFGWESEDSFRHLVEETLARDGSRAAMTAAAAACGDIARAGVRERTAGWKGAITAGLDGDIVQSLRIYRREPILAVAIALILALVAGPTVAIVGTVYTMVLAPLPYRDAGRLVVVMPQDTNPYVRAAKVADYRAVEAFSAVGGIFPFGYTVAIDGPPERVLGYRTTGGLMTELGVPFVAGRDMARGESDVLLVTRSFARSRFGTEAAAIGKRIALNGRNATIVGVLGLPPSLPGSIVPGSVFGSYEMADAVTPTRRFWQAIVIARLAPGTSLHVATEKVRAADARAQQQFGDPPVTANLVSLRRAVTGPARVPLLMLFAAIIVVFTIGVVSVASLVLARAAARAMDVAVRQSLGASRWRLTRAWIVDGMTLAIPGVALGAWLSGALHQYVQQQLPIGFTFTGRVDAGTTLAVALVLAIVSTTLFGLAPVGLGVLRSASLRWQTGMLSTVRLRYGRSQAMLIALQVAVSVVLVCSAVWLSASLWRVLSRPVGFDPEPLIFVSVSSAQPPAVQLATALQVQTRLKESDPTPGAAVAIASSLPGVNAARFSPFRVRPEQPLAADADRPTISRLAVSANYFQTLGVPLVSGRYFTEADSHMADRVVILGRSFAARWFPEGALGKMVAFGANDRREIVGIVEDVHTGRLIEDSTPQCYMPITDSPAGTASNYIVRTARGVDTIRATVTAVLNELDPRAQVMVMPAQDTMAMPLLLQTIATRLTVALAGTVLLLAVVNIYALSAFAVVQRMREIGIRVALGATASQAMRLVMRRAMAWAGGGMVIGLFATTFFAAPLVQGYVYKVTTREPALLSASCVIVAIVALIAAWLPARHASRIDPAITLRAE